ncbi:MAG: hypothetical protein HN432_04995 [Gammaproteobacteria bacterium]|nr:hypothetical protein [Gammaproteobacteria bacterium]
MTKYRLVVILYCYAAMITIATADTSTDEPTAHPDAETLPVYILQSEHCVTTKALCRLRRVEETDDQVDIKTQINTLLQQADFDKKLGFVENKLYHPRLDQDKKPKLYSGRLVSLHANGTIRFTGQAKKGLLHGAFKVFHSEGQIAATGKFRTGDFSGKYQEWHPNGALKKQGKFDNSGALKGKYEEWFESGQRKFRHRLGLFEEWYENGNLRFRGCFFNGKQLGQHREWYESGQLALSYSSITGRGVYDHRENYQLGEGADRCNYQEIQSRLALEKVGYQHYPDGTTRWKASPAKYTRNYPDGTLELEHVMTPNGSNEKSYHLNGLLAIEKHWDFEGRKTGTWKAWNYNGELIQTADYKQD